MKATIHFRTANDDAVSILIEPIIKRGLHSIRVQRMDSKQKEVLGISRFHVDSEQLAIEFLSFICMPAGIADESFIKFCKIYDDNKLMELIS